ncbi:MAG TPA: PASTA domain-containing protein [Gemmatimonadales bacterium]
MRVAGLVVIAAAAGYLVSLLAWPAPILDKDVPVALVVGLPEEAAVQELTAQGFRTKVHESREPDPTLPAGHVTWQDPPGAMRLPKGSLVNLTLSSGPSQVAVPDVALFELDDARRVVTAAGLTVGSVDSVPAMAERGVVVSTRPPIGSPRPAASRVDLVVSRGPADVRVPNLVGLAETVARQRLGMLGLAVGLVDVRPPGRARPNTVLEQRPAAGVLLPRGGRVDLVIADRGS